LNQLYKQRDQGFMTVSIQMKLNEELYLRDPQETKLGKSIIQYSIDLIDEIGFEGFTFKKLAERINSTEASIYRYFENKHLLLVYLVSWYWEWMKFRIQFNTMNIDDPIKKLKIVLPIIVDTAKRNTSIDFVDEDILHRIVVAESTKAYHTKNVDKENQKGFFWSYKSVSISIADIIEEINPDFPYPRALASNLLDMGNNHIYYAQHLPSLTDIRLEDPADLKDIVKLLEFFVLKLVKE